MTNFTISYSSEEMGTNDIIAKLKHLDITGASEIVSDKIMQRGNLTDVIGRHDFDVLTTISFNETPAAINISVDIGSDDKAIPLDEEQKEQISDCVSDLIREHLVFSLELTENSNELEEFDAAFSEGQRTVTSSGS